MCASHGDLAEVIFGSSTVRLACLSMYQCLSVFLSFSLSIHPSLHLCINSALIFLFQFRMRLPEDRDPRQGQSPLFGVHVALEGDKVGVVKVGDSVMVSC